MLELTIREETWDQVWPEAEVLAQQHFEEVDGGVEPRRTLNVDAEVMRLACAQGWFKIIAARLGPRLIGYYTWQISEDIESKGLRIAQQGAWFVLPGHPRVAHGMFDLSISLLRAAGVQCIYPHHRLQGRGAGLGKHFERRGAKPIQLTYSLWIEDKRNG